MTNEVRGGAHEANLDPDTRTDESADNSVQTDHARDDKPGGIKGVFRRQGATPDDERVPEDRRVVRRRAIRDRTRDDTTADDQSRDGLARAQHDEAQHDEVSSDDDKRDDAERREHEQDLVHQERAREELDRDDDPISAARRRFGGLDILATLCGTLAALGMTVLLGGVLAGIGSIGYQLDAERDSEALSTGGWIAGLLTLLVAFLIGGWVAGRMARYDGGINGVMTAVWFIVIAGVLSGVGAALGDRYNVFGELQVPRWFSDNATTPAAILSGVGAFVVMVLASYIGGKLGDRYHQRVDKRIAGYRPGGVA